MHYACVAFGSMPRVQKRPAAAPAERLRVSLEDDGDTAAEAPALETVVAETSLVAAPQPVVVEPPLAAGGAGNHQAAPACVHRRAYGVQYSDTRMA